MHTKVGYSNELETPSMAFRPTPGVLVITAMALLSSGVMSSGEIHGIGSFMSTAGFLAMVLVLFSAMVVMGSPLRGEASAARIFAWRDGLVRIHLLSASLFLVSVFTAATSVLTMGNASSVGVHIAVGFFGAGVVQIARAVTYYIGFASYMESV